jgi:hypothetical protein
VKTQEEPKSPISPVEAAADDALAGSAPDAGIASLDKVREILFGGQLKDIESRVDRLEARLIKESTELKEEVNRRLEALERRTMALAEQFSASQREFRQHQIDVQRHMGNEIRQQVDHALLTLAREVQELRTEKVDRTAIANLFGGIARRLTDTTAATGGETG